MNNKIILLSLLSFFIFSSVLGQGHFTDKLIGKWQATDGDGVTGGLEFIDSIHVIATIPNHPLPTGEYIIDTTKTPMWLDMTFKEGNNTFFIMTGLIKILNDKAIKWQVSPDGKRSETFNKETTDKSIILRKKP